MILYGFGKEANRLFSKYAVPNNELEVIIDNNGNGQWISKVISWDEFVKNKDNYSSNIICIGVINAYKEIYEQIKASGLFREENIIKLSEWIAKYPLHNSLLSEKCKLHKYEEMKAKTFEVGDIESKLLRKAKVLANRYEVLDLIPKNGVVAEVGVAFGGFSKYILEKLQPKEFYAIDMYDEQLKGFWNKNIFEEQNISHYEWYRKEFQKYIDDGVLKMHKSISWDAMNEYPDNYFDYLYLDAAHDYQSVIKDITAIYPKMKNGSILQFNDYTYGNSSAVAYGVIPVVNKFVNDTKSEVLYFCLEKGGYHDFVVKVRK